MNESYTAKARGAATTRAQVWNYESVSITNDDFLDLALARDEQADTSADLSGKLCQTTSKGRRDELFLCYAAIV